jgi:tetratricopeptide (TPR) repeat protein
MQRRSLVMASLVAAAAAAVFLVFTLNVFHTNASATDSNVGAGAAAVSALTSVVTAVIAFYRARADNARPTVISRPGGGRAPRDRTGVEVRAARVMRAIDDHYSGRRSDVSGRQLEYVEGAIARAEEALGTADAQKLRSALRSFGLDPSMLIRALPGHDMAATDWSATAPGPEMSRILDRFRQLLLDNLAQAPWLSPNARKFFRDAKQGGRKFSREWAGLLPSLNVRLKRLVEAEPGTEQSEARDRCRIPLDDDIFGRLEKVTEVAEWVTQEMGRSQSAVAVITGEQPGVGASVLAREVARTLERTPLFRDRVLYFNVHGLNDATVKSPDDVAREVLKALDGRQDDDLFGAYEAAMQGKRVLLVLDDVKDSSHVKELARHIESCCVLVTSRRHQHGYASRSHQVDRLAPEDSVALLLEAGEQPQRRQPWSAKSSVYQAAEKLAEFCDNLPMALKLVSKQIADRPAGVGLEDHLKKLSRRLETGPNWLRRLQGAEQAISNAIALSYHQLDEDEKRLFLMCHAARPHEVTARELAACLQWEWERVEDGLAKFVDMSLAREDETNPGGRPLYTYTLFNLIRMFAEDLRREDTLGDSGETREFTRRYVTYIQDNLAVLSEGGADSGPEVDLRLRDDQEPIVTAVRLALDNGWGDLGIPLAVALNQYLTVTGVVEKTIEVDRLVVRYHLEHDQPEVALTSLLAAASRLKVAGLGPAMNPTTLLTAAVDDGQQALNLAWRYELGHYIPDAAFVVSLAAAGLKDWEQALASGATAANWLRAQNRADEAFPIVMKLFRFAWQAGNRETASEWAGEAVELNPGPDAGASGWFGGIGTWPRGEPPDTLRLAVRRVEYSAVLATSGNYEAAADTVEAAIEDLKDLKEAQAAALLLEAQVRLAAMSLFLEDRRPATAPDAGDAEAEEAQVAEELAVLRRNRDGEISGPQAAEVLHELIISPARNIDPVGD